MLSADPEKYAHELEERIAALEKSLRNRESLSRIAALVEFSDDAITSISLDGRITSWNRSAERLLGFKAQEALGQSIENIVPADVRDSIPTLVAEDIANLQCNPGYVRRLECQIVNAEGRLLDVLLAVSGIFDESEKLVGLSQVFRDITELKRADRERSLLASVVEFSEDGIISIDRSFRVVTWNRAAEKIFGFAAGEAIGKTILDLYVPPEIREDAIEKLNEDIRELDSGRDFCRRIEVPAVRKDGTRIVIFLVASGIFDANHRLMGLSIISRDVTAQKRAEREQALLASIVTSTDDAVVSLGLDGRVSSWNRGAQTLTGYTAAEAIGQSVSLYLPPGSHDTAEEGIRSQLERARRHEMLERVEFPIVRKDGVRRDVLLVVSGIYDSGGNVIGLSGIMHDITEQRHAERERAMLAAIVNASQDAIISASLDKQITAWNEGAKNLFGVPRNQALGKDVLQFIDPDEVPRVLEVMGKVASGLSAQNFKVRSRRCDGTLFDSSVNVFPIFSKSGAVRAIGAIGRDITEIVRLQQSESRLAAVLNASDDAILSVDLDMRINSWNRGAEKLFGIPLQDAIGRGVDIFLPPEDLPTAMAAAKRVVETGEMQTFEHGGSSVDGTPFVSSVNLFPIRDGTDRIVTIAGIGRDITQIKHIEGELREAHEYTRGLIESSIDAMVVVDGDLRIIDGNEQLAKLTETAKGALISSSFESHFSDPDAAGVAIKKTFADGYVTNVQLQLKSASGKEIPISFNASLFYRAGKVFGIFGVARDVTEERAIERTLRAEREYSRGLVHSSPDGLLVCDSQLTLTDVNEQAIALTGYSRAELIGIGLPSLFTEPTLADDAVAQTHEHGRVHDIELQLLTKSAGVLPVSLNISNFSGVEGGARRIIVSIRDISERKRAETERSLLAAIVDSSGDAIYSEDSNLVLTSWNPAAERLFGYASGEILGRSAALLVPLDRRSELAGHAAEIRATGKSLAFESKRVRRDGQTIDVAITQSPIFDGNGNVSGLSVTAHDISNRKRMEEELAKARDAALEAARVKSEFLANMSHEIRTPLNSIIGLTGLLLDGELSQEQRDFARDVRASGDALLHLINDILDFSKMSAGKLLLEDADFDLTATVEAAAEILVEQARRKGLEMNVSIDPDVPRALRGDPGRLKQILTNLLVNAVKFTERGEIAVSVTKLSEDPREAMLRFEVRDTGIGIDKEKQKILFQPFTQVDASTTRHYGGTGLGLSIARELVTRMSGTIAVTSNPGEGSSFWFTAKIAKQLDPRPASERFVPVNGAKILIVDDNANSRKILERLVAEWGMNARTAASAEEGLLMLRAAAAHDSYEIALLDVMMPAVDGIEMARQIKADPALEKTAVIFASSVGSRTDMKARLAGLDVGGWLMKPVAESSLYDAVIKVLGASDEGRAGGDRKVSRPADGDAKLKLPPGISGRVLLVEDNPINKKVAKLQLGKLGLEVDTAMNGREALEASARHHYDLIFMDCQMPELDGYEATRELRRREGSGPHSIVIAMTAHALPGDREKCLAAGMDAYISKPVTQEALENTLAQLFSASSTPQPRATPSKTATEASAAVSARKSNGAASGANTGSGISDQTGQTKPKSNGKGANPCDRGVLDALRAEGNNLLNELADLFETEVAQNLNELERSLKSADLGAAAGIAHKLKGSAAIFGANQMQELALQIDLSARNGDAAGASAKFEEFRDECDRVRVQLSDEVSGAHV